MHCTSAFSLHEKFTVSYIHAYHKYLMIKCVFSQFYERFLKGKPSLWLGTCGDIKFKEPWALATSLLKMSNEF